MILRRQIKNKFWTLEGLYKTSWGFVAEWVSPDNEDWCELLASDYTTSKRMLLNVLINLTKR